jgi:hypothetical protein
MAKESFREKIIGLAIGCDYTHDDSCATWESIARELIAQMSEQDCQDFYDYFMDNCM